MACQGRQIFSRPRLTAKELHSVEYRKRIYDQYVSVQQQSLPLDASDTLKPRAPFLRRVIERHFPTDRDSIILDLGCGSGVFIHFIREAGYHNVIGVDVSWEQVAEAKNLGIEGIKQGDLIDALEQLPDESQDVVVSFDVIEHFTKEELVYFTDQVLRVLRAGGRWIIHVPNGEGLFGSRIFFSDFTHQTCFTPSSIAQLLKSSGFSSVRCYEDTIVIHGLKSALRRVIWEGVRLILLVILAAETGEASSTYVLTQNLLAVAIK